MDIFLQQLINGLVLGSVYAMVALGYTMVYGILELINFAHGEITMMGAMVALSVIGALALAAPGLPGVLMLAAGLAVAIPVCMALGLLIERIAYRPLRHAPRLAPLITAIGVSIVLQNLGSAELGGCRRNGLDGPGAFSIGGADGTADAPRQPACAGRRDSKPDSKLLLVASLF